MAQEIEWTEWAFKTSGWLASAIASVAIAIGKILYEKVSVLEKEQDHQKQIRIEDKLENEKTFATKNELNQHTVRLEATMLEMRGDIKALGGDIKTLIARK